MWQKRLAFQNHDVMSDWGSITLAKVKAVLISRRWQSDHNIPLWTLRNIKTDRVDGLQNLSLCFCGPTDTACLFSEALGRVMAGTVTAGICVRSQAGPFDLWWAK